MNRARLKEIKRLLLAIGLGKFVGLTALIPAFSPGEKEKHSLRFWKYPVLGWMEAVLANQKPCKAMSSPWGEETGEGGREIKSIVTRRAS